MKPRSNGQHSEPPALAALKRAARSALDEARAQGTPCYVWQDGRIVDIAAEPPKSAPRRPRSRKANGAKRG